MTWWQWLIGSAPVYDLPPPDAPSMPMGAVARSELRADEITNPTTFLGSQDDKGAVARPSWRPELTRLELSWLFAQGGLAARIVSLMPAEEVRGGWKVKDATAKTDPMQAEDRRLSVTQRVETARVMARLYGGALLYPVIDDGQALTEPLNMDAIQRIENLTVYERVECQAIEWEGDPRSPLYNQPRLWLITPITMSGASPFRIHASRVIHFMGARVTAESRWRNLGHGASVLEAAWEAIRNRAQLSSAGATLVQELIVPVITINDLDARGTGDQGLLFRLRMRLIAQARSMLGMIMLGANEKFERQPISITGFDDLATCAKEDVAASTGYPITKLFTPPASGLGANSEGDRESWAESVHASDHAHLYEPLIRLYTLAYLQKEGPTNGVLPDEWDVEFGSLDRPNAKTAAEINKADAEADDVRIASQVVSPDEVRKYGSSALALAALNLEDEEVVEDPIAEDAVPLGAEKAQDLGLNGAQITGLLAIVDAVATGAITPDGGVAMIMVAMPTIEVSEAARIVAGAKKPTAP